MGIAAKTEMDEVENLPRIVEKFDRYETMLEEGLLEAIMRLGLPLG
jgi:hypothetical protein